MSALMAFVKTGRRVHASRLMRNSFQECQHPFAEANEESFLCYHRQ